MDRINVAFHSQFENFSSFNVIRCGITSTHELGLIAIKVEVYTKKYLIKSKQFFRKEKTKSMNEIV